MRIPKSVKSILKYVPILAVLAAIGIGLFIGRDLYQLPVESQSITPTQLPTEPGNLQPLLTSGVESSCDVGLFYTSLPLKCKTWDGRFIQANGSSPLVLKVPGVK